VALNLKYSLLLLLTATLGAIFFLKPHKIGNVEKKGVPQVVFLDFKNFEITPDGVESMGRGLMAEKFATVMKVKSPAFRRVTPHGIESIRAKEALYKENRSLLFSKDVKLTREDGWIVSTQKLFYDFKKRVYTTKGLPFVAIYGKSVIEGKNMFYYQKSGKIIADSIKAKIAEEDI